MEAPWLLNIEAVTALNVCCCNNFVCYRSDLGKPHYVWAVASVDYVLIFAVDQI